LKLDINKVENLNDKKLLALLFMIDNTHLEEHGEKIFGDEYTKEKRTPEAKIMGDIFDIIANDIDLEEDDERLYIITEFLDSLDIEILEKEKFIELNFVKMEEDYDKSVFTEIEKITIGTTVAKYLKETPRQMANATFQIEKVRTTAIGEVII
jgi:hypothetical protein